MKLRKSISVLLSFILIFSVFAVPTAFAGEAFDNIDDAGRYLRAELVKREPVIEFDYLVKTADISDGNYFNDLFDTIEAEATRHTGVPDEGDYINNHYDVMNPALSAEIAGSECSVHFTFNMTYRADAERERATTEKLREVLAELALDGKNDYEKVVAVHDYILDHVTYDHEHVNDENYLPQYTACAALLDGTAVCQGYATLMYRMLLEVGVDCRVVTGYVDGEGHAWNIVKLGDLYYNIDATFDDGEGMDPRECFLKNAAHFADHERDPEFLTEAFLNAYPISPEDYSGDGSELVEKPTLLLDAPESCKPDDVISVRAILKNDAKFQSTSMMLKWDPEVLEFLSQGSDISDAMVEGGKLSDETARIDLIFSNIQNVSELTLATFTFKVLRGDTDTSLSLNVIDGDYDGVMEPDPTDVSIHVEAEETEAPTTEAPTTEAPTTEAPTTEAPTTEAPTTEAPTTEAPTTEAPTTEAPTTEAPTTEAPTTEAPTTEAPTTEAPTTEAPTTEAPTTEVPTTEASTTEAPTTEAPTTETPVTHPEIELFYGDADLDGKVKASDARMILRHAAKIELLKDSLALAVADVDNNGKVNSADARAALRVASRMDEKKRFDDQSGPLAPEPATAAEPATDIPEPSEQQKIPDRRKHVHAGGAYILPIKNSEISKPSVDDDADMFLVIFDSVGGITGTHYIMISPIDAVGDVSLNIYDYDDPIPKRILKIDTNSSDITYSRSDAVPDPGALYSVPPVYFITGEQPDGPTIFSFAYALEYDNFMRVPNDEILQKYSEALEANGYGFEGVETDEDGTDYYCYRNENGSIMDYALFPDEEYGTILIVEFFDYGD